ncbi:MAG: hypothetical protein GTO45_36505 [Candidatus Aminicenantes bacterium]|nr:hypothetical protein [Candidatus Aminicenantes bacterium]NIM84204.1 hypothetical protein [Candidatus Aminicenantes bacterium]NIN23653.1 hypothetical protein [Candidatus Aminicenantes bacterium]NIN47360.1 hypothetical protein [Candidatus Aminicenantes bacterium]NIN90288.1 hypothetical protein [Candidatus Aminicenantes bacterium]
MNKKKIKWLIFVWLWGMVLVNAEDFFKVKERIIREAWFKTFSLYFSPKLSITDLGYTSNIYSYQDIEEPDWTADVGINLSTAAILKDRFILTIDEFPYYSFYLKNKNEEAFNNLFQFAVYTHLGRFNLNYKLNLNYIRERPNSEFGVRTRLNEQNQVLSIDYGKHDRFFINLYAARNQREYTDEQYLQNYDLSHLDREDTLLGITLNKRIFSRTRLWLNYEYYVYRFLHASEKDGIGGKLSLGVDFPEISRIKGSLRFGWKSFFPKNPDFNDFLKPFGSGTLSMQMLRRFKFHFNYLVDNFFSFWNPNQYFDERSFSVGIEFYFNSRIKVGYDHRWGNLSFKSLLDGSVSRTDDFYRSSFSLAFRIFKKMGIVLDYTIYHADSTQLDFKRRYNFIGGKITHEF